MYSFKGGVLTEGPAEGKLYKKLTEKRNQMDKR